MYSAALVLHPDCELGNEGGLKKRWWLSSTLSSEVRTSRVIEVSETIQGAQGADKTNVVLGVRGAPDAVQEQATRRIPGTGSSLYRGFTKDWGLTSHSWDATERA